MKKENVIVLIGDLKNSRNIPNREEFDNALYKVLVQRSLENQNIVSNYTLIGDEIQAVYSDANGIFSDAMIILEAIYPQKMRFSFGISDLIKPINREQTIAMDGPAFYLARDGVNYLKEKGNLFSVILNDQNQTELFISMLNFLSIDMLKWSNKKIRVFSRYMQGLKTKEIISQLALPKSTVYDIINDGNFAEYKEVFTNIEIMINEGL